MEYLDQVIDETLRLYPPVHAIPRVTTECTELGGYTIPTDTQVLVSVWDLHYDPRFYDEPLAFDPGPWKQTSPRDHGYAFLPFGGGPRICIGRHFARLEMKTVLAAISRRYRLDAGEEIDVAPQMTAQPADPVLVELQERT